MLYLCTAYKAMGILSLVLRLVGGKESKRRMGKSEGAKPMTRYPTCHQQPIAQPEVAHITPAAGGSEPSTTY